MLKRILPAVFLFVIFASTVHATSGACSSHEGVNCAAGPDTDGSVICNDGTNGSSILYRDMRTECEADFKPFADIDETNLRYEPIINLYEYGVINGYPDNTYKPDNTVNRAEYLKVLIEGNGITPDPNQYNNCFPDVVDDWYAPYVCYAKENGWVQGYPDGEFKAVNTIAFVEAIKMLVEVHGYSDELTEPEDPDYWYVPYGELAIEKDIVNLTEAPYDPLRMMTRADIADMTWRSMQYKEQNGQTTEISLGETGAPITIIEYSDFQCPFCKRLYDETFEQLRTDYIDKGDVLYIVKDFPLSFHTHAREASHAARCANDQGKFWEMRELLYMNQSDWSSAADASTNFSDYAESLNLDTTLFDNCMVDEIHMAEIDAEFQEGVDAGIMGTPTLIVNGEFFVGSQPYKELINLVDQLLYAPF